MPIKRRHFLQGCLALSTTGLWLPRPGIAATGDEAAAWIDPATAKDWRTRWERKILDEAQGRACDHELGEELGWLVSPVLNGFYYGHLATGETKWIGLLVDWADACIRRAVREPDGFRGWPKGDGGGGDSKEYAADSLLGEAMLLRPMVLMAAHIQKTPALVAQWGSKAEAYLKLAGEIFRKWDSRSCWREVKGGGLWVVPAFGVDAKTGGWSAGYAQRETTGFSNPDNKQNHIARWLLALHDATGKAVYRARAESWFRLMKSRLRTRAGGKCLVWNYWDPAGPWDYKPDGSPRHWVGVHPNGGYYGIDAEGIVDAFEHGLVFSREDIARLIVTNRDCMWNQQVEGAKFQRIDGEPADPRWKDSPGVLWTALVPYDATLRRIFVANHNPAGWGGLGTTPWFVSLAKR
jgi:hypothetical protein